MEKGSKKPKVNFRFITFSCCTTADAARCLLFLQWQLGRAVLEQPEGTANCMAYSEHIYYIYKIIIYTNIYNYIYMWRSWMFQRDLYWFILKGSDVSSDPQSVSALLVGLPNCWEPNVAVFHPLKDLQGSGGQSFGGSHVVGIYGW